MSGNARDIAELSRQYDDPGASATDDIDGNVSVSVTGLVDTDTAGRYTLVYTATDTAGNHSTARRIVDVVGPSLFPFYTETADRFSLPETYINSLDTFIYAADDINAGNYASAQERIENIFSAQPLSDSVWFNGLGSQGLNTGRPPVYYGMRMLDDIVSSVGAPVSGDPLRMTALIAPCAEVRRPVDPDDLEQSETVTLDIDPAIREDNYALLYRVTETFRQWTGAIRNSPPAILQIYELPRDACDLEVNFRTSTPKGETLIISYADTDSMLENLPPEIVSKTDIWWTITPSGVPGDGSAYDSFIISGGYQKDTNGNAVLISDDAFFIRKPVHMGSGPYSEVEQRAYFPQWFQHEYMHHVFSLWPEFGLETTAHQWFDRSSWPDDFEGQFEADYFAEALEKRLSTAIPSLEDGLRGTVPVFIPDIPLSDLAGSYERLPVENGYHEVEITLENGTLVWSTVNGNSWTLEERDNRLFVEESHAYGGKEVVVFPEVGENGKNTGLYVLWFLEKFFTPAK